MKRIVGKLRSRRGMSLTETLICVGIMAILFSTIVSGVNLAAATYRRSVNYSGAQTLTSTLYNALANELHYATNIRDEGGNTVFDSETFGAGVSIKGDSQNTRVLIGSGSSDYKLLSDSAYIGGLNASASVTGYADGIFSLTITVSGPEISAVTTSFSVRALNAERLHGG